MGDYVVGDYNERPLKVMVFSVAVNFYEKIFHRNIVSHRHYAARNDYDYYCFNSEQILDVSVAAWLKIVLIKEWLALDYDLVMFVDADCHINDSAPKVLEILKPDKSIYLAKGFSGRVNSGVMILLNTLDSKQFIATLLENCEKNVEGADWGENGHVIYYSVNSPCLEVIDRRWNNNTYLKLDDFIRHYCGGTPFRESYEFTPVERYYYGLARCMFNAKKRYTRIIKALKLDGARSLKAQLEAQTLLFRRSLE